MYWVFKIKIHPMCQKQKFTKKEAKTVLNLIRKHRRRNYRKENRIYHCPDCNGWHLTSK